MPGKLWHRIDAVPEGEYPPLLAFRDTQAHDVYGAVKPDARLSGNTYVVVTQRYDIPLGGVPDEGRVLVVPPHACNHGITICPDCADSWETDHTVDYGRTAGGRQLQQAMTGETPTTPTQP